MFYMRKLIGKMTLLLLLSAQVFAAPVKVDVEEYLPTNLDFMFIIKNKSFKKIVLDCQSFINGVNFLSHDDQKEIFMLDYGQCEDIHTQIYQAKKETGKACLMLEFEMGIYKVTNQACN
jgi:hypothetical protein